MAQRFRSVSVDDIDAPADLFERNKHNISQWAVVTTFRRGERLQAVTGNNADQIMIADSQGKPWLGASQFCIYSASGDARTQAKK